MSSDSTAGAVTGGLAGKNAVENNFLLSLLVPPPPVAGQTTPQSEANTAIAKKLDGVVKAFGEVQVKQCLSGGVCSPEIAGALLVVSMMEGDSDEKQSQPNIGKGLTDNEKAELGGAGSGTGARRQKMNPISRTINLRKI